MRHQLLKQETKPLSGVNIFLVEDEAFIAMAIIDTLTDAGASMVEHALSLAEADETLKECTFDAAILDLRLPDGNTSALAKRLVDQGMPIVFHSGHAEIEMLRNDYPSARICHKPCKHSEFVVAVQELLKL